MVEGKKEKIEFAPSNIFRKTELPSSKTFEHEYIYNADDGKPHYTKTKGVKTYGYSFYLRPYSAWFTPCKECQKQLHLTIIETTNLILGNKSYEPAVELQLKDEIDDNAWETLIDRVATKEDMAKVAKKELDHFA